jgi:hypothetical protein
MNPRTIKAADALAAAGYAVRVVSARNQPWITDADEDAGRARKWTWMSVDYARETAFARWLYTGLRQKISVGLVERLRPGRSPRGLLTRATKRVHTELVRAALQEPSDLFLAAGLALGAAVEASCRMGVHYAIDLEDFHSGEAEDAGRAALSNEIVEALERRVLHRAAFLLAGSEAISRAYEAKYSVTPIVVNNTFPLPRVAPPLDPTPGPGLRLYWFSQTIGPGRGIDDAIRAMGLAQIPGELHLRGRAIRGVLESINRLVERVAPRLKIIQHELAPQDAMVKLCQGLDVGLAVEPGYSLNNRLALSNKSLTYILGGLAVAFTDTEGQRPLALDLGEGALLYSPGDVATLATGLKRWAEDKDHLARAKRAAWDAARRRWHWEHADERGALLRTVGRTVESMRQ